MNLDEMISTLSDGGSKAVLTRVEADSLIAALRAGQQMRDALELSEFDSGHVEGWVRSKDYYIAGKAVQDWDAAVKGDVE
jgi:hypothetical protein